PEPEPEADAKPATAPAQKPAPAPEPEPAPAAKAEGNGGGKLLSPVVRRLIAEHGLDPAQITGTGAGGRITRNDVLALVEGSPRTAAKTAPSPTAAPAATARREPLKPEPL